MELTYYILREEDTYEPFYTYKEGTIDPNEVFARQLCDYFVVNKKQYRLLSNEMEGNKEMLIVEELGTAVTLNDEHYYENSGVRIEFREYESPSSMPLLYTMEFNQFGRAHWEAMRYLLKDYITIPNVGLRKRDSAEIDEDRRCYVIYVTADTY
ncbi:MAG: RNA helicase [Ectobacillus sp.]